MSEPLPDVRSVVEFLGGVKVVSGMFGLTENAVWNWISTDRFPANTYVAIRNALKSRRRSAPDDLWRMAGVLNISRGPAAPCQTSEAEVAA